MCVTVIFPSPYTDLIKMYKNRIMASHLLLPTKNPVLFSKFNVKFSCVIPITQKQVDPNIRAW